MKKDEIGEHTLSVLMIVRNTEEIKKETLASFPDIISEIVVVVNVSFPRRRESRRLGFENINKKTTLFFHEGYDLGKQRAYGLENVKNEWVLAVDSDEVISEELGREIKAELKYKVLSIKYKNKTKEISGYHIPFQNHFLGKPLHFGGENYKMLRLFRKDSVEIAPSFIHENFRLKFGKTSGELQGKLYHYSYRSLIQMFTKFTDYAVREAKQRYKNGERATLKKLFLDPIHMFWARFVEDKGYKDGIFRIPLDIGFAYMEWLMYVLLYIYRL